MEERGLYVWWDETCILRAEENLGAALTIMWNSSRTSGQNRELGLLLSLLLATALIPALCVLWFMTEAAQNERMAVQQKLSDLYQTELAAIQGAVEIYWSAQSQKLESYVAWPPAAQFKALVTNRLVDSAIIFDAKGHVAYPVAWFFHTDGSMSGPSSQEAYIRSLVMRGDEAGALQALAGTFNDSSWKEGVSTGRRLSLPYLGLWVLEQVKDRTISAYRQNLESLKRLASDYQQPMLSSQRLLLMRRLTALESSLEFPTLRAEEMALRWRDDLALPDNSSLVAVESAELWQLISPNRQVVGLYTKEGVTARMKPLLEMARIPGASVALDPINYQTGRSPFLVQLAGRHMPGWELRLYLDEPNPFAVAAEKRVSVYLWTAVLVVAFMAFLVFLLARYFVRQVRLNRLKNDFVATVSHELKTPLASMRVLVDTLLDGRPHDAQQSLEYLQLISKENERLSRLIDSFLTFSRMERNKRALERGEIHPETIVQAAVEAVRERFNAGGFQLQVEVQPVKASIVGDRDALTTVLINLLDNAYKYSESDKRVAVRCREQNGSALFEVEDHGLGLSRRDAKRVFDRFYQVDQTLSRRVGGCGLGLSIVKFIVEAHGGSIEVESQLGQGSVFTIKIPAAHDGGDEDHR
jgi:signal transduction histidine kinase